MSTEPTPVTSATPVPGTIELPNEARTVENPVLAWLQSEELGWRYEDAKTVAREYRIRRPDDTVDEREVLLLPILKERLIALNPGVITDDERADRVISRLRVERDNQEWLRWLRNEKTMSFAMGEPEQNIRLIDYDKVGTDDDGNDYLASNQFRVEGPKDNIRTDVLLFVNGIPLVNIEAKTTGRDWKVDWTEGAKQCGRYSREAPQLYYSNLFCGGVNEFVFKYGIPATKFHTWFEWRDPSPHNHIPKTDRMKCSVYGLLDRRNLLDILRNFVVFEVEQGVPVKKIARYQQFAAANEIVKRSVQVDREQEWRRGLVWHTQGSGKSLTILFAAKKMWNDPALQQPTILIIIDREQLQDQMFGQFVRTNTETCRVAVGREDLMRLLGDGEGYRGIIVTIMHKFTGHENFAVPRRNVIALIDEALNFDKNELGEVAFPLTRLREMFKLQIKDTMDMFAQFPKTGDRENIVNVILPWLNKNRSETSLSTDFGVSVCFGRAYTQMLSSSITKQAIFGSLGFGCTTSRRFIREASGLRLILLTEPRRENSFDSMLMWNN